ncbi:MAG: F-type H+-transporting ATPase subunit alpha, partial [Candidatus Azotimanducaceae bacterium]
TRRQLEHGERINELMKQKQYSPMSVAEMGIVLFAANEGYLVDVAVNKVLDFESALMSYMNSEHADFMAEINEKGAYTPEVIASMKGALDTFKSTQTW